MIVLGIFMPFLTIVVLPLRVVFLLWHGPRLSRIGGLLLLAPWGYWLVPILKFGYVSTKYHEGVAYGTGPTVSPGNWLFLAVVWGVFEMFLNGKNARVTNEQSKKED
jgi:hypothetical protein